MTIQQEALRRINQMSEDGVKQLLLWIDDPQNSGLWNAGSVGEEEKTKNIDGGGDRGKGRITKTVNISIVRDDYSHEDSTDGQGLIVESEDIDWDNDQNAAKEYNIKHLFKLEHEQEEDDDDFVSHKVFENALDIVLNAIRQPEIFKTYENSVNLQYELKDSSYLEFEVFDDRITCMIVPKRVYDDAYFPDVEMLDIDRINKIIGEFYGVA